MKATYFSNAAECRFLDTDELYEGVSCLQLQVKRVTFNLNIGKIVPVLN
jgi:hypothetical protein